MSFKNLSILWKILSLLLLLGSVGLAVVVLGGTRMSSISRSYNHVLDGSEEAARIFASANRELAWAERSMLQLIWSTSEETNAKFLEQINDSARRFGVLASEARKALPAKSTQIDALEQRFNSAFNGECALAVKMGAASTTLEGNSQAMAEMNRFCAKSLASLSSDITSFMDQLNRHVDEVQAALKKTTSDTIFATAAIGLSGLAVVLIIAFFAARRGIAVPLDNIIGVMNAMRDGNLSAAVPGTDRHDELGTMARAVEAFRISLSETEALRREKALIEARGEVQMELAHANRVATMGQLTASVAHEVAQPVAGTVTNAQAALRWLDARPPDMDEVRQALCRIVRDGYRAGDVLCRIRDLVKRMPARKGCLNVNEAIHEIVTLSRAEMLKNGISVQIQSARGLPLVQGDRVQLQQVILNLIVNAIEAMSGLSEGLRELMISSDVTSEGVLVAVRDTGPGLSPESQERMFEPFYTTKPDGMGMGLSICHAIIEAHGGRLRVTDNVPRGAIFQFTVPVLSDNTMLSRDMSSTSKPVPLSSGDRGQPDRSPASG